MLRNNMYDFTDFLHPGGNYIIENCNSKLHFIKITFNKLIIKKK